MGANRGTGQLGYAAHQPVVERRAGGASQAIEVADDASNKSITELLKGSSLLGELKKVGGRALTSWQDTRVQMELPQITASYQYYKYIVPYVKQSKKIAEIIGAFLRDAIKAALLHTFSFPWLLMTKVAPVIFVEKLPKWLPLLKTYAEAGAQWASEYKTKLRGLYAEEGAVSCVVTLATDILKAYLAPLLYFGIWLYSLRTPEGRASTWKLLRAVWDNVIAPFKAYDLLLQGYSFYGLAPMVLSKAGFPLENTMLELACSLYSSLFRFVPRFLAIEVPLYLPLKFVSVTGLANNDIVKAVSTLPSLIKQGIDWTGWGVSWIPVILYRVVYAVLECIAMPLVRGMLWPVTYPSGVDLVTLGQHKTSWLVNTYIVEMLGGWIASKATSLSSVIWTILEFTVLPKAPTASMADVWRLYSDVRAMSGYPIAQPQSPVPLPPQNTFFTEDTSPWLDADGSSLAARLQAIIAWAGSSRYACRLPAFRLVIGGAIAAGDMHSTSIAESAEPVSCWQKLTAGHTLKSVAVIAADLAINYAVNDEASSATFLWDAGYALLTYALPTLAVAGYKRLPGGVRDSVEGFVASILFR